MHIPDDGYYIMIEYSTPALTGDRASLVSKVYRSVTDMCVSFFYNMYGEDMGMIQLVMEASRCNL